MYFSKATTTPTKVPAHLAGDIIRRMEGDTIPFGDETFDIVVNNMVMEHVPDLDRVLDEIRRVLRPGGLVLSLFPDRALWIEGHCRIPFLHRFPRGGRARVYYAACLSSLGIGARRDEAPLAWSRRICVWLDQWTYLSHPRRRSIVPTAAASARCGILRNSGYGPGRASAWRSCIVCRSHSSDIWCADSAHSRSSREKRLHDPAAQVPTPYGAAECAFLNDPKWPQLNTPRLSI